MVAPTGLFSPRDAVVKSQYMDELRRPPFWTSGPSGVDPGRKDALAFPLSPNFFVMTLGLIASIVGIGAAVGLASGVLGIGGGIFLVPALVYALGYSQHQAQGTTLALLCLPVGMIAALRYHQEGLVEWRVAGILFCGFLVGAYVGADIAVGISPRLLRQLFGASLVLVGVRMLWTR
jgi:hypothetical protein